MSILMHEAYDFTVEKSGLYKSGRNRDMVAPGEWSLRGILLDL